MEERLDIFDKNGEKTGESCSYHEAHRLGLLHWTVHVWFLNSKGELLLQKRSKDCSAYPSHWDVSVGGHISSGQTSLKAAERETQEELGVRLPPESFQYLFTVEEHVILNEGTYLNNEFNDIYLVRSDLALSKFSIDPKEVEDIHWISLGEFKKWLEGKGEKVVDRREEHQKLLEYLSQNS